MWCAKPLCHDTLPISFFRPFERTITLQKDSTNHVGFVFKSGKITAIAKDTSAARNGLLIDHAMLEVQGQNVIGMKVCLWNIESSYARFILPANANTTFEVTHSQQTICISWFMLNSCETFPVKIALWRFIGHQGRCQEAISSAAPLLVAHAWQILYFSVNRGSIKLVWQCSLLFI